MRTSIFVLVLALFVLFGCGPQRLTEVKNQLSAKPVIAVVYKQTQEPQSDYVTGLQVVYAGEIRASLDMELNPPEWEAILPEVVAGLKDALPNAEVVPANALGDARPTMFVDAYLQGHVFERSMTGTTSPPFRYHASVGMYLRFRKAGQTVQSMGKRMAFRVEGKPSDPRDSRLPRHDAFVAALPAQLAPELKAQARAGTSALVQKIMADQE
jgi:hypothetical protein